MNRFTCFSDSQVNFESLASARKGGVVRTFQLKFHDFYQSHSQSLSGSEGKFEEDFESQDDLDSQVTIDFLLVRQSVALCLPGSGDLGIDEESDVPPIDQSGVILFPVAGAVRSLLAFGFRLFGRFVSFHSFSGLPEPCLQLPDKTTS